MRLTSKFPFISFKKKFEFSSLFPFIFLLPLIFHPLNFSIYELPKFAYLQIFISIAVLYLIYKLLRKRELTFYYNKHLYLFVFLWIFSLFISTILSVAPNVSLFGSYSRVQGFLTHIFYIIYFVLTIHYLYKKDNTRKLFRIIYIVGFIAALYGILQKFGIDIFSDQAKGLYLGRVFSSLGHPNFLGQFLLLPIWIGLILLRDSKGKNRIYHSIILLALVTCLVFTENRASMLGLGLSLGIFLISHIKLSKIFKILISIGIIGLFIAFIFAISPSSRSIQSRLLMWQATPQIVMENPISGSGLETYEQAFQKYVPTEIHEYENLYQIADRSHNEYIDILSMQGFAGLFIYLFAIISALILLIKKKRNEIVLYSLISILVSIFFSFSLTVHWVVLFTLLAIVYSENLRFKKLKIRENFFSIFSSGAIFVIIVFLFFRLFNIFVADIYLRQGFEKFYERDFEESISYLVTANELNPNQDEIAYAVSDVLYLLGKKQKDPGYFEYALAYTEIAGDFTNKDFRYNIETARLYRELKEYEKAEEYYLKASELTPKNPILLKDWGVVFYEQEKYKQAAEKLQFFIDVCPKYWQWTYELEKRSPEEQERYRIFFKEIPDFWDVFAFLSRSYAELGETEKAEFYLNYVKSEAAIEKINGILKKGD